MSETPPDDQPQYPSQEDRETDTLGSLRRALELFAQESDPHITYGQFLEKLTLLEWLPEPLAENELETEIKKLEQKIVELKRKIDSSGGLRQAPSGLIEEYTEAIKTKGQLEAFKSIWYLDILNLDFSRMQAFISKGISSLKIGGYRLNVRNYLAIALALGINRNFEWGNYSRIDPTRALSREGIMGTLQLGGDTQ